MSTDEEARPTKSRRAGDDVAKKKNAGERIECERCGAEMYDSHCKIICPRCGYQRDCSDP